MDPFVALAVIAVLVVIATALGLFWKSRQGRVVDASRTDLDFASLGVDTSTKTTLLQFSTEFCAYCPATRRILDTLASEAEDVAFVEYDLTDDVEATRRFGITQTPTVFVIDHGHTLVGRIGGAPRVAELRDILTRRGHQVPGATHPLNHEERTSAHAPR